jgi:putative oxidoreductase
MDVLVLIGRILFVFLFLASGMTHFAKAKMMTGYAQSRGLPLPGVAVPVSGAVIVVGALMVLLGVWADLGALLLVIFLVPTALLMHAFWKETDAQVKMNEMNHFMKDLALGGAALMLFAFFAHVDDVGLTITGPTNGTGEYLHPQGITFNDYNPYALRTALDQALNEPARLADKVAARRDLATQTFHIRTIADSLEDILKRVTYHHPE